MRHDPEEHSLRNTPLVLPYTSSVHLQTDQYRLVKSLRLLTKTTGMDMCIILGSVDILAYLKMNMKNVTVWSFKKLFVLNNWYFTGHEKNGFLFCYIQQETELNV